MNQLSNILLDFICDFHPVLINTLAAALLRIICNLSYSNLSSKILVKTFSILLGQIPAKPYTALQKQVFVLAVNNKVTCYLYTHTLQLFTSS